MIGSVGIPLNLAANPANADDVVRNARQNKVWEAAQQYESLFLGVMMEEMFSGLDTDGPFGGGHSEGIFRSLLTREYAEEVSRGGGIGVADALYREMLKFQEV